MRRLLIMLAVTWLLLVGGATVAQADRPVIYLDAQNVGVECRYTSVQACFWGPQGYTAWVLWPRLGSPYAHRSFSASPGLCRVGVQWVCR